MAGDATDRSWHFILVKSSVISSHASHFAGGKHAFLCMSSTLASRGHKVDVVCASERATLLVAAMSGAAMAPDGLHSLSSAPAPPRSQTPTHHSPIEVARWRRDRVTFHAVLKDGHDDDCQVWQPHAPGPPEPPPPDASVLCRPCGYLRARGSSPAGEAALPPPTLFEHITAACGQLALIALVQNVHFLPFGPSGTGARTASMLTAWAQLAGAVCVSKFVAGYIAQHLPLELRRVLGAERDGGVPPLHVTTLNAWGCFGEGPFLDLRAATVRHLGGQDGGGGAPVIGVLKLTPEKGCSIVAEVAARTRGRYRFLIVSGDPAIRDVFEDMPHVKVVEPQPDVGDLLGRVCCVLAPSLWLEAWGMVVTDAMLRGVPVITSSAGALPEAGLGVSHVVHVQTIDIPPCCACGAPAWAARRYPRQDVDAWLQAIDSLLCSVDGYMEAAWQCRATALEFVGQGAEQLQAFLDWLAST